MKFVGIIRDHENFRVKGGRYIKDVTASAGKEDYLDNVVFYLEHGVRVFSFLEEVFDGGIFIAPLVFYTDGKWIWPSYLPYYLNRGYWSLLPGEFISDVFSAKFIVPEVGREKINEARQFFTDVYK
ncbi:hypothetical protein [Chitinophaga filiformis]|uniref:Immunity protein 45 n=1 Tax=Chitinophaga filiformis TaxID=104663 RepID=A0ABY4HVR8_CHIFI|nr:hypothetical protein [Chitinophaga filiformis]UPK67897.1 hypothetical protein MYF79_23375 [Chitinophaga filiformis]